MTSQRNGCSISTSSVHLSTEALLLWLCSFAQQLVEAKIVVELDSMCFGMVDLFNSFATKIVACSFFYIVNLHVSSLEILNSFVMLDKVLQQTWIEGPVLA